MDWSVGEPLGVLDGTLACVGDCGRALHGAGDRARGAEEEGGGGQTGGREVGAAGKE